ncbi:hypothetical protein J4G53_23745 [Serratia ureilytica]|uniref:hypothetical protein n=1 Tax=Serratia ureilytica TaxID=300181 RepID=UPI001AA108DE|nr:hypothetical protein [Serratia ureilytica]MBO1811266.1 hypothetical protein [Serratia ureilytica]
MTLECHAPANLAKLIGQEELPYVENYFMPPGKFTSRVALCCLAVLLPVTNLRAERIEVVSDVTQKINTNHNAPDMSGGEWYSYYDNFVIILGLAVDNNSYGYEYAPSPAEKCVDVSSTYLYQGASRTINGSGPSGFGGNNQVEVDIGENTRAPKPVLANIVLNSNCDQSYKANLVVITGTWGSFHYGTRAIVPVTIPARKDCWADVNNNISFGEVKANSGPLYKRVINSVGANNNATGSLTFVTANNNLWSSRSVIWYDLIKSTGSIKTESHHKWSGPLANDYYIKLRNFDSSVPAGTYTGDLTVILDCY